MGRIEHVIVVNDHAFINGGQAKVAIESAIALAEANINVTFFAACGPVEEAMLAAGIKVVCLNQKDILHEPNRIVAATRGIWNGRAAKALHGILEQFDPTKAIVHCHGFAKALSPAIGPVLIRGPLAHVYTMHEFFLACPNGGFYDYRKREVCTRKALGTSCLFTNCDVRHPAHKAWRVARQAALWSVGDMPKGLRDIIYISQTQKRVIAPYLNPQTRLHYVPNPVSIEDKQRVRVEENNIFLFVGRLTPEKGGLLFSLAAKLADVKAVFVGDGPEREAIQAANPDAIITGWVKTTEVESWLEKSRCLVFPSLWYETFGLVAFEALARGVPVICGAWNAAAEAVEDDVTGATMTEPNPASLASAISRLKSRQDYAQLSLNAIERYRSCPFSVQAHVDTLLAHYLDIMEAQQVHAR